MVAYIAVDESGEFLCDDESGNNIALSDGMMNSQSNWVIVRVTYYHRDQLVRLLSLLPMLAMLGMVDFSGLPYPPN